MSHLHTLCLLADGFEPVFSTAAMREADRRTMEDAGLPGVALMETAGRGAAQRIAERFGPVAGQRVAVLAGKGHNGADGLVVARVLAQAGARVTVAATMRAPEASADAARMLALAQRVARHQPGALRLIPVRAGFDRERFDRTMRADGDFALIVDALLGIGATGPLRWPVDGLAAWANRQAAPTVALDLPSGIDSDTGTAAEGAVRAALTLAMAAYKPGLLFGAGAQHAGEVALLPIGIPPDLREAAMRADGSARRATDAGVQTLLPRRSADAHKYSAGMVLAVAGSGAYAGAAALACGAAARSGAGYVVAGTPASARDVLRAHHAEIAAPDLPGPDGYLTLDALETLLEQADKARALLIGPGLGRHDETQRLVRHLIAAVSPTLPIVLDADGLYAISAPTVGQKAEPRRFSASTRAAGCCSPLTSASYADSPASMPSTPMPSTRTAASPPLPDMPRLWNAALLFKGLPSVVAAPDGQAFVSGAGGPALATAGTGDVLAGLSAGLLAQGLSPLHAGACALHLSGRAAERFTEHYPGRALVASDLIGWLRAAI